MEVLTEEAAVAVALTGVAMPGLEIGPAPTRLAATTTSLGETHATSATQNEETVAEMLEVAVVKVATEDSEIDAVDLEEIDEEATAVIAEETVAMTVMVVDTEVVPRVGVAEEEVEAIVTDPIKNSSFI